MTTNPDDAVDLTAPAAAGDFASKPETRQAIESILMVADQPVEPSVLAQLLEVPKADVEAACEELGAEYQAAGRGFILSRLQAVIAFRATPTWLRTSSALCSRGNRAVCRPRPSSRWPSWRTSNRFRECRWRRSEA